jgi:hypothetical protein
MIATRQRAFMAQGGGKSRASHGEKINRFLDRLDVAGGPEAHLPRKREAKKFVSKCPN